MTKRIPNEPTSTSAAIVDGRNIRAVAFHEARMEYVRRLLGHDKGDVPGTPASGRRALVVGSVRGHLAHGLVREGLDVTAVDPSPDATRAAQERGEREGLTATYLTAAADRLDVPDAAFDLAYYADTFEVTDRLDEVLAEAARVLTPGGTLVYDTVNRTPLSRLIYLGAFQRIPQTRIMPPGRYVAQRLRPPEELSAAMARQGLHNEDICAFQPTSVPSLVTAIRARKRGRITDDEIASAVTFVLAPDHRPIVTYLGHARKR